MIDHPFIRSRLIHAGADRGFLLPRSRLFVKSGDKFLYVL
jgi:hypothetical protein